MIRTIFFVLLLSILPFQAMAQSHESALRTLFSDHLERQKKSATLQGNTLRTAGEIKIDPKGKFYAVTLPHLSLHKPDGSYTDIGIISANVSPGKDAKSWVMNVALPTPIRTYHADKSPRTTMNFGKQSFNGVWYESISGLGKMDARYNNITIINHTDNITATIPEAHLFSDMKENKNGWDGNYRLGAKNISIEKKNDPGISKIGQLELKGDFKNFDAANMAILQSRLTDTPETSQNMDIVMDLIGTIKGPYNTTLRIENADLQRPAIPGSPDGFIKIKSLSIGSSGSGLNGNDVTMALAVDYDGLALQPVPAHMRDTLPATLKLNIAFDKFPLEKIIEALKNNDNRANNKIMHDTLSDHNTKISFTDSHATNAIYALLLNGNMVMTRTNPTGLDGNMRISFEGMEDLAKLLQSRLMDKNLTAEDRKKLSGPTVLLTTLQILGKQEKSSSGKDMRVYDISIAPDGAVMLNGQNLQAIMALMPKPKPQ